MIGMCVSIRVLRSHCVHGPKSFHKSRTNSIIAATAAIRSLFFFLSPHKFFSLYFMCAKQQSTVLFFFRMHVDNAKERCVSINIVIYYLLNTFKWQNSRKTVLFLLLICKLKMQRVFLVSFFSFVLCDFGPVIHVQCTKLKIAFVKFLPNAPSTRQYHGVCTNIRLNIDEWNKTQLYRA